MKKIKYLYCLIKIWINPLSKRSFLFGKRRFTSVLDVGCGNDSPKIIKTLLPNSYYVGIDVCDYNQGSKAYADEYIVVDASDFVKTLLSFDNRFDLIICAHNIEHCDDRLGVLLAILAAAKPGGQLYLSFPSAITGDFPGRRGTLNYYDDPTHKAEPPNFDEFLTIIKCNGYRIVNSSRSYKPFVLWLFGLITEPVSKLLKRNTRFTWFYWGFESIIIAEKEVGSTLTKSAGDRTACAKTAGSLHPSMLLTIDTLATSLHPDLVQPSALPQQSA